jgi:hypothetical protein
VSDGETPMIDPHGDADDVISDVPELSNEEVERRIGARERAKRRRVATATPARIRTAPSNRRAILWRDSATILVFVIVALLAARFLLGGDQNGIAGASPTPPPSGIEVTAVPTDTGFLFTPVPTLGDVVDPSNRINATPTPIPVITLPPPTPKPPATPKPTPTLKPGTTPKPTPTPAPTVAPLAAFTATCNGSNAADFNASASKAGTGATITSWEWAWDDGTGDTVFTATTSHAFQTTGTHNVILTIHTSTGGHDAVTHAVTCP